MQRQHLRLPSPTARRLAALTAGALAFCLVPHAAVADGRATMFPTLHTATAGTAMSVTEERARTLSFPALPSARTTELDRLQNALSASDLQSTGFYLPAGVPLNVIVHRDGLAPTLVVGAPDADSRKEFKAPRSYQLEPGTNTVTDAGGGVVYVKLVGDSGSARISLGEAAQEMPHFVLGTTTEAEFQQQLDTLLTPYVELVSPNAMVTVERGSALKFRSEDHGALMSTHETIIAVEDTTSGLDGQTPQDRRQVHPYHYVGFPSAITGVGAYATHGHMSFPPPIQDRLLTVEGLRMRGWGVYHELGHQHQQTTYKPSSLTEVTVNIYSLAVNAEFARRYGQTPRLHAPDAKTGRTPWQSAPPKIGQPGVSYNTTFDPYEKLVMFEQLRLTFGDDFWPRLHKLVRSERPLGGTYTDEALRLRNLVVLSSRTSGTDLRDFFRAWGVPVDAEAVRQLDALGLPRPATDPTEARDTRR